MKNDSTLIAPLLQKFFVEYLSTQKRVSPETVSSYRDTFRILLHFMKEKHRIEPTRLRISDLSVSIVLSFLDHLEEDRKNSIRSRNLRLAAIRSFFRVVALYDPTSVNQASSVLAIPLKRCDKPLVNCLSRDEIDSLLAAPDLTQFTGRRDHALLLTLYNSGARASELIGLKQSQVSFGTCSFLSLHGKGRKERSIPLWSKTSSALQSWFAEISHWSSEYAFPNASGQKLTRNGLDYILQRAVQIASLKCSSLAERRVTPHMVRHSTASHLLQSGVDLSVIALWLGHESVETTHVYLEADLQTKERALSKVAPAGLDVPRFKPDDEVLAFLNSL
jgi:site-specific recombinase XerD